MQLELIAQKAFFEDFFILQNNENPQHQDFVRFLQEVEGFALCTDFSDWESLQKQAMENPLLRWLLFGQGSKPVPTITFQENLSEALDDAEIYEKGSPFKLFFTEKETPEAAKQGFVALHPEGLAENWRVFDSQRRDRRVPIDSKSKVRFDSWEKVKVFQHCCHSILIFDKYLFTEKDVHGNLKTKIDLNLFAFFRHFLAHCQLPESLQLYILTDQRNISLDNDQLPENWNDRPRFAKRELKAFFNAEFPNLKLEISVVHYDSRQQQEESEHDRGIYTNYFFIEIGKGLNIFDSQGKIDSRSKIEFNFAFRPTEQNLAQSGLESFAEYLSAANKPLPRLLKF